MKQLLIATLCFLCFDSYSQEFFMLVGSYDSPDSNGIMVMKFNSNTGQAKFVGNHKISNPSFLAISPDEKFVYAVSEVAGKDGNGGDVIAFAFNKQNGLLTVLNRQRSGGDHPCHIEIDKTGKWLFVSNYTGGSFSVLPVYANGSIGEAKTTRQTGSSVHPQRQKSSHVHGAFIAPANNQLLVTDLGTDKVLLYDFNPSKGKLKPSKQTFISSLAGSGPRSLSFHPVNNKVFVIEELTGTVAVYSYNKKKLKEEQRFATNPPDDSSFPGSAHLAFSADGKFLYTSNRAEQNIINVYAINDEIRHVQTTSTLGRGPRHFSIDPGGSWLFCANQLTNEIILFNRDKQTGLITASNKRIQLGKPVCIKWINSK